MEWIPLALALLFGMITILLLTFLLRFMMKLSIELKKTSARLERIEKRLAGQAAEVAALKEALTQEKQDPVMGMVQTAMNWRSRGPWMTVGMVGIQLFQSYWRSRKTRALPGPAEK
jgi:hypothetical protein